MEREREREREREIKSVHSPNSQYFGEELGKGRHQFLVVSFFSGFSEPTLRVDATNNIVELRSGQDSWERGKKDNSGRRGGEWG